MTENFFNNLITFRLPSVPVESVAISASPGLHWPVRCSSTSPRLRAVVVRNLENFAKSQNVLGSVWNLSISSLLTWRTHSSIAREEHTGEAFTTDLEVIPEPQPSSPPLRACRLL